MRTLFVSLVISISSLHAATVTPIQPNPIEPDLLETLDAIYGVGAYSRIDDDSDHNWAGGQITVRAVSTYASATESLGFCVVCDGSDDLYFDQTFVTDGIFSTPLTVSGAAVLFLNSQFTWLDSAQFLPFVGKVYSDPAMNTSNSDHFVTFGLIGQPYTFVIAIEDWLFNANPGSDADYQDLIFEVTYAAPPSGVPAPEPGSLLTMAGGLAALLVLRKRMRKARA